MVKQYLYIFKAADKIIHAYKPETGTVLYLETTNILVRPRSSKVIT